MQLTDKCLDMLKGLEETSKMKKKNWGGGGGGGRSITISE